MVGTVRLWHVSAGGRSALMLGPLAVEDTCRGLGVGAALMDRALEAASARGHGAVILLGDAPYYTRFGFTAAQTGALSLPGPFERDRLLGLELREGALDGARGMIAPSGAPLLKPKAPGRERHCTSCRTRLEARHAESIAATREAARPRLRRFITTILMILISVMIVRDIFVRRWSRCHAGGLRCDRTLPLN